MKRRKFISTSGKITLGFLGLHSYLSQAHPMEAGYGPLQTDPEGILNLPKGFSYKIISRMGEPMADGLILPGRADGMATFEGKQGKVVLIRNHEVSVNDQENGAFGPNYEQLKKLDAKKFYDYARGNTPCLGGTTTVVFDENSQQVESQFMSLAGTIRNCAGGKTPWNSWITCEEDVTVADDIIEHDHGFNFEVPATEKPTLANPVPLKDMGRFNHEAVAVDPRTGIVYQTEDRMDGLIYRFIPNQYGKLARGGKLQMLVIKDKPAFDTRNWQELEGEKMPLRTLWEVEWIDVENPFSKEDDLRFLGKEKGAAIFARGEGAWWGENEFYFACTAGGANQKGQVFRYVPSEYEGTSRENEAPGKLEVFAEPNDTDILQNCDNLTVAPWGDVVLVEDRSNPNMVGITPDGKFYKLAENVGYKSEMAGVTFSPSGKTLFVNIQHAGLTFAITGRWGRG